ncbi:MAG: hypothetical protein U0694_18260 [Anaerolineae bacterium]
MNSLERQVGAEHTVLLGGFESVSTDFPPQHGSRMALASGDMTAHIPVYG